MEQQGPAVLGELASMGHVLPEWAGGFWVSGFGGLGWGFFGSEDGICRCSAT